VATHRRNFVRGVAGKVIKKIDTGVEEGQVFIDIQFKDKTSCVIYIGPAQIQVERAPNHRVEEGRRLDEESLHRAEFPQPSSAILLPPK
jgi:hypothetical protein